MGPGDAGKWSPFRESREAYEGGADERLRESMLGQMEVQTARGVPRQGVAKGAEEEVPNAGVVQVAHHGFERYAAPWLKPF